MVDLNQSVFMKILLKSLARTYYREIIKDTPGKGEVRDGWDIEIRGDSVVISNNEFGDIINFLEEGTKSTIIRAKNKKFLRFEKPKTNKSRNGPKIPGNIAFEKDGYIFAKAVRHPGIEARHFIYKILNSKKIQNQFQLEFDKNLEAQLKK